MCEVYGFGLRLLGLGVGVSGTFVWFGVPRLCSGVIWLSKNVGVPSLSVGAASLPEGSYTSGSFTGINCAKTVEFSQVMS